MTRKIILTLVAVLLLNTLGVNSTAKEKPIPKPQKPVLSKNLAQQQVRVNKIKSTKEGQEIFRLVDFYSNKYEVDKKLVHAVILAESGYQHRATSSAGAQGLMQVMPVHKGKAGCYNLYNKQCNIETGVKHIAGLNAKYKGDTHLVLAAYNAGGGAVDRSLRRTGKIPPSTKGYVKKVMDYQVIF